MSKDDAIAAARELHNGAPLEQHHRQGLHVGADAIVDQLEAGNTVLAGIDWPGLGGHEVLVMGLEVRDGEESVRVINPWSQEELIPRDEFQNSLMAMAHSTEK